MPPITSRALKLDGSITVRFGGCDGKTPNCLLILDGWNYTVRFYRPRKEIFDGTWKFPELQLMKCLACYEKLNSTTARLAWGWARQSRLAENRSIFGSVQLGMIRAPVRRPTTDRLEKAFGSPDQLVNTQRQSSRVPISGQGST